MICAEILRQHGFVPIVPNGRKVVGTAQSKARSHVPSVPTVPTQKHKGEAAARDPHHRPVLHFRLVDATPNAWATCVGRPGETVDALRADLIERFGERLMETRTVRWMERNAVNVSNPRKAPPRSSL